jgi:hypothetical protein
MAGVDTRVDNGAKVLRPAFKWHGPTRYAGDPSVPVVAAVAYCRACASTWHAVVRADRSALSLSCPGCCASAAVTAAALGDA